MKSKVKKTNDVINSLKEFKTILEGQEKTVRGGGLIYIAIAFHNLINVIDEHIEQFEKYKGML